MPPLAHQEAGVSVIPGWQVLLFLAGIAVLAAALAASGVLRVTVARPSGKQRREWREARHG
jgi:hypothetical protein